MVEFNETIFAGPASFRTASRALIDYHVEKGWMPLHDVGGVNCENPVTIEN